MASESVKPYAEKMEGALRYLVQSSYIYFVIRRIVPNFSQISQWP